MLEGQVQLTVGRQAQVLSVGESAQFVSDVGHGYANPAADGVRARFCLTVFEPNVTGRAPR